MRAFAQLGGPHAVERGGVRSEGNCGDDGFSGEARFVRRFGHGLREAVAEAIKERGFMPGGCGFIEQLSKRGPGDQVSEVCVTRNAGAAGCLRGFPFGPLLLFCVEILGGELRFPITSD